MNSTKKVLILRLSSLGDVVLATAALEALDSRAAADWVVAEPFAELINGHSRVHRVWRYSKVRKLTSWVALGRELFAQRYDEILDLHGSLRTRILRGLFAYWKWRQPEEPRYRYVWKQISKARGSLYPYYLLKSLWPVRLRPEPLVSRFAKLVGGTGAERPNLSHLLRGVDSEDCWDLLEASPGQGVAQKVNQREGSSRMRFICLMPGSAWPGKCWPTERFLELARNSAEMPVVLGSQTDQASHELVRLLREAGVAHRSGVGRWSLTQVARVLAQSEAYIGNDTGLGHLAEALGKPAYVIFGPTTPDMGFGPWRPESKSAGLDLWCRPCGKDGGHCHRVLKRHLCMKALSAEDVGKTFGMRGAEILRAREVSPSFLGERE